MILLIDFSKAFDSISHNFIYDTLRFLNFGEHFIDIVKTMLTNRKCTVMIDGYETDPINIERGVPQGDTASPFIFIIVLEILLLRIRYDPTLIPIKLEIADHKPIDGGNLEIPPLHCFADDMTAIYEETEQNLVTLKTIFGDFHDLSGLEINEGKTYVIRIGDNLDDLTPLTDKVKFKYATEFRLLGVDIDNKLNNLQSNFTTRLKKIRNLINQWSRFQLSVVGNITVSKTFLISQLGYLLSVMECDPLIQNEIQEAIDKFVFKGKPWIATDRRYIEAKKGGTELIKIG